MTAEMVDEENNPLVISEEDASDVDLALPYGNVYQLPPHWQQKLTDITYRKESPSSITSFLGCPLKWYLERYADIPEEAEEPPSFPAVLGSFIHRVLEVFYSEPAHLRDIDLLNRTFRNAWDAIKQESRTGIIPEGLQEEFNKMLEAEENPEYTKGAFYKKADEKIDSIIDFDDDPANIDIISTETWVRTRQDGVTINGKVDRIRKSSVGTSVEVDDYKTGRPPSGDDEVSILSLPFISMGLYALMVSRGAKGDGTDSQLVRKVNLMFLGSNELYTIKINSSKLSQVEELVTKVIEQMEYTRKTGQIVVSPADTPSTGQCSWCPARNICPEWTDGTFSEIENRLGI